MSTARMPLARVAGRRPLRPRVRVSPAHRAIAVLVAASVDARYRLPGSDLGSIETRVPGIILSLPARRPVYITVMPLDYYGESVGRRPVAEELLIP